MNFQRSINICLFFIFGFFILEVLGLPAVCRRPCGCRGSTFDCTAARGLDQMPDISSIAFTYVRLAFSDIKSIPCDRLSPDVHRLDVRNSSLSFAAVCALVIECPRVREVISLFRSETCRPTITTNTPGADSTVATGTDSTMTPTDSPLPQDTSNNDGLGAAGAAFGSLGLGACVAVFFYHRRKMAQLRDRLADARAIAGEQRERMEMAAQAAEGGNRNEAIALAAMGDRSVRGFSNPNWRWNVETV